MIRFKILLDKNKAYYQTLPDPHRIGEEGLFWNTK